MEGYDYSALPKQQPLKVSLERTPGMDDDGFVAKHPVITNNWVFSHGQGEPGYSSVWHTHMPEMHQIAYTLEGTIRWRFKNNDGEEERFDLHAGEVAYIPGGMENKIEVVGDQTGSVVLTYPHMQVMGVEQLFTNTDSSRDDGAHLDITGLWYDTARDEIAYKNDDALID